MDLKWRKGGWAGDMCQGQGHVRPTGLGQTKSRDHKGQGVFAKRLAVWWDQKCGLCGELG